jgi:CRP/FNR family transcriptional regulator, cyclic AMP receptor protein
MINVEVLLAHGASLKRYEAGEAIFKQGSACKYYYQVVEGCIIWENLNDEGKRFIQYIVEPGESFGELPLFDGEGYAANAIAEVPSLVVRLPKETFLQLLKADPELHFNFTKLLAQRTRQKFLNLKTFAFENPEARISNLLDVIKTKTHTDEPVKVNLTRQQMANMTGLRVETVIRVIRNLSEKGQLQIAHGKIFL